MFHRSTTSVGEHRGAWRAYQALLVVVATLTALIIALWVASPPHSLVEERSAPVVINGRADAQAPSVRSQERLDAQASAHLNETQDMIARMKAHGIGD